MPNTETQIESLKRALQFYANGEHLIGQWVEWDPPDGWRCPGGAAETMAEDGATARAALDALNAS